MSAPGLTESLQRNNVLPPTDVGGFQSVHYFDLVSTLCKAKTRGTADVTNSKVE